jgi:hypothetical protein
MHVWISFGESSSAYQTGSLLLDSDLECRTTGLHAGPGIPTQEEIFSNDATRRGD